MVRKHLYFSGQVQGVGFRYRSAWIAQSLGLTGWVSNLWDGRGEMEVQGDKHAIERMIQSLYDQKYIQIDFIESDELPLKVSERKFRVV